MCLQCTTNPWFYGKVLPNFYLMRARRQYFDEMQPKDWGLVICNDPSIIFKTTPYFYENEDEFYNRFENWCEELICSPDLGYTLIDSFLKVKMSFKSRRLLLKYGYWYKRNIMMQLYVYIADYIQNSNPITETDCFPKNDTYFLCDYNFDPKLP